MSQTEFNCISFVSDVHRSSFFFSIVTLQNASQPVFPLGFWLEEGIVLGEFEIVSFQRPSDVLPLDCPLINLRLMLVENL